ncbi:zinc finger and BTB domain-containing protein 21 [Clupea harengus]|uniref:Zinc finger and BTB domain-containing protein 21 n=1 Tax=Clupea harengus TaxID=7950 RepID=A0A6P3VXK7_CLUHA|nr:zinc finger and BTB domain-containing protein 21 [Clupea harengus]
MENLVHYSNPAHAISLLSILNEQRLRGQLCDIVLVVGEQRYQAHRSVLAASSEYFQSLFTRRDSEPRPAVQLDFCEPDAFELVLNYIYSSSLFVDKGSLAAIQELGYSLGIPFLTNIMAMRPQVSYCISRKRVSFKEEDDGGYQQRSVIVRQSRGDAPGAGGAQSQSTNPLKSLKHGPYSASAEEASAFPVKEQNQTSRQCRGKAIKRSSDFTDRNPSRPSDAPDDKSIMAVTPSIMKGRSAQSTMSVRPQLTSSVSFSESQIQHASLQPYSGVDPGEDQPEPHYSPKMAAPGQQAERHQPVDRSGPLIKSLLRRSLSMDSPVPIFSPALELKDSQNREHSVVKMATAKASAMPSADQKHQGSPQDVPPLILRPRHHNMYERGDTQGTEVHVKTEPSSPLADPSDIIRITVGDNLPVNFRDLQMNFDENPKGYFNHAGKRRARLDNLSSPYKRSRVGNEHHLTHKETGPANVQSTSNAEDGSEEPGELRPNKMFKCWNCLKIFRSNAGLYRHVNMYHNPEKPYACDICHKRFHTNFKVWTHCQTQHGVVQNPAPSSSSYSVLDEKFQRKLIDIVREREIKKALIMKLRRNKQNLQVQPFAKKSLRSRSTYVCPYCGKMFWFQSQFRQHLKMHPMENDNPQMDRGSDSADQNQNQIAHLKENQSKDVYSCKLCNAKLSSPMEQGDHERGCRHATVCPYCGLRFSSASVKRDHEGHCDYKKLTCLECMRTFKSSFSIWRHQVEVHNHNMMTVREQLSLSQQENHNQAPDALRSPIPPLHQEPLDARKEAFYRDSSSLPMFDSEDSSYAPEDLSMGSHEQGDMQVKEEPIEEAVCEEENAAAGSATAAANAASDEPGVWPCEKCGKLFSSHKDLERHQELLCHIKPFICHICHKAFRTNFRLWSHFQSHVATADEPVVRDMEHQASSPSPSPPLSISTSPPNTALASVAVSSEEEPGGPVGAATNIAGPEQEGADDGPSLSKPDGTETSLSPQESDTLFYHAPTLSALTFKRQYMCKLCHRTFKTAFSLWSHEQSHNRL